MYPSHAQHVRLLGIRVLESLGHRVSTPHCIITAPGDLGGGGRTHLIDAAYWKPFPPPAARWLFLQLPARASPPPAAGFRRPAAARELFFNLDIPTIWPARNARCNLAEHVF